MPASTWRARHPGARSAGGSGPGQDLLAPGVQDAQREHRDKDSHLYDGGHAETRKVENHRPGEEKNGLDRKKYIKVSIDVISDLRLSPVAAHRIDTALVRDQLARGLGGVGR